MPKKKKPRLTVKQRALIRRLANRGIIITSTSLGAGLTLAGRPEGLLFLLPLGKELFPKKQKKAMGRLLKEVTG